MKLEQIAQVISLASTGSFTESAKRLYMSQPNLSQSIKQLEAELGSTIFERTPAGLVLTPFGQEYLTHLYAVQNELDNLNEYCYKQPRQVRRSLNVVTMNCNWINDYFSKTVSHYENFKINFSLYNTENIDTVIELVQSFSCDLAVISLIGQERKEVLKKYHNIGLEYHKICSSPLYVMVGKKNPLYYTEEPITLEAVTKYPYVNYGSTQKSIGSYLARSLGISQNIQSSIWVNTNSALYNVVANTTAFTISANILRNPTHSDVKAFPLTELPHFIEFGWLKLQRTNLSDVASDFIDFVGAAMK